MPKFKFDDDDSVLVEFEPISDSELLSEHDLAAKSEQAMISAMTMMRRMAQMVSATMGTVKEAPSQVEVAFGLRLKPTGKAAIATQDKDSNIAVKFTWRSPLTAEVYGDVYDDVYDDDAYDEEGWDEADEVLNWKEPKTSRWPEPGKSPFGRFQDELLDDELEPEPDKYDSDWVDPRDRRRPNWRPDSPEELEDEYEWSEEDDRQEEDYVWREPPYPIDDDDWEEDRDGRREDWY